MRISLYIPKGKKGVQELLHKEIALTRNIQDKKYGKEIAIGLNKILNNYREGTIHFYDTEEDAYATFDYAGKEFHYKISKEFITKPIEKLYKKSRYILILMDANECTIGELNGKKITTLWHETSNVPKKQGQGGQSALRFQENRRLQLLQWEKKIGEQIKRIYYDEKL